MPDALEELVLSGALFDPSRSPPRARSPSDSGSHTPNTDDELFGSSPPSRLPSPPHGPPQESIGMGPGRTGVKGVIRDRNEARERDRAKKDQEMKLLREKMEAHALTAGGTSFFDEADEKRVREKEENEKEYDSMAQRNYRRDRWKEIRRGKGDAKGFGYLREVGVATYVEAVEKEPKDVWVVLHIYHPGVDRCAALDSVLTSLARTNPYTKFLRIRATAVGFASTRTASTQPSPSNRITRGYGDEGDDDEEDEEDEVDVDEDMLPTLLVYRGGDLVFNWVRVDLEAGKDGIQELLRRHHILPPADAEGAFSGSDSDDYF